MNSGKEGNRGKKHVSRFNLASRAEKERGKRKEGKNTFPAITFPALTWQ